MRYGTVQTICALLRCLFLFCGLLAAARTDIKERRIPNSVLLLLLRTGFFLTAADGCLGSGYGIVWSAISGFLAGGLLGFLCALLSGGGIGAGDVKLLAVTGVYAGYKGILAVFIRSMLMAGVVCGFLLCTGRTGRKQKLPLAPFVLLAVIWGWICRERMQ